MQTVLSNFPLILTHWRPSLQTEAFQSWEARNTNCFLLTKDLQRLPRIQGITSWNEGRDCRKHGDFAPSEVTTTASKLKSPPGGRADSPGRFSPLLQGGFLLPALCPRQVLRYPLSRQRIRVHENFTVRLQPCLGTRKGSGTLPRDEAVIKLEQQTLIFPVYLQLMG